MRCSFFEGQNSFFVQDVEYRLDSLDIKDSTVVVTKLIPDSEPISETLSIYTPRGEVTKNTTSDNKEIKNQASIEEAFNSFF